MRTQTKNVFQKPLSAEGEWEGAQGVSQETCQLRISFVAFGEKARIDELFTLFLSFHHVFKGALPFGCSIELR